MRSISYTVHIYTADSEHMYKRYTKE